MTKVKQGLKTAKRSPVTQLKTVKNNPIQKKKNNKIVNTPVGKVRLINGKKVQNNITENKLKSKQKEVIKDSPDSPDSNSSSPRSNNKKNYSKHFLNSPEDSPKVIKDSPDSPDSNSSSPKSNNKKNSSKQVLNSPNGSSGKKKKIPIKNLVDEEDESDVSIEDINEGVVLPDDSTISQDDSDDDNDDDGTDEEESDIALPNILGQSLADDTDEDDSDFEEEENDEDDHDSDQGGTSQLKGVKMFKGLLKQKFDSTAKNVKDDDDDDDDDDHDDGDDHDDDDDDDDDDNDDDDNMNESDLKTDTSMSPDGSKNKKGNSSVTENEEEDDEDSEEDESEDDDEDDDDDEESTPGLKDLLGNSIVDDDEDDEDFEGEDEDDEDIDISDEELEADVEDLEVDKRTVYVGNIPKDTKKEEIKKVFKKYGAIKSIRIRNVIPQNIKISKKVAAITGQIHDKVDSFCMLIVFKNEESVSRALDMNGKKFKEHFLRVTRVGDDRTQPDAKKAVFLGNLSFRITDNNVWDHFKQCGDIESVRLIRDKVSGMGKGIGYVNFQNEDSVPLALELDGSTLLNRQIRVKRCSDGKSVSKSGNVSTNNRNKRLHPAEIRIKKSVKKLKKNDDAETTSPMVDVKKKSKAKGKLQENSSPTSEKKKTVFQGQKATVGKKVKKSKLDKQKKKMAAILTAKPKKVQKV